IPLEYGNIGTFEAGLAPAQKDELWGFIDTENKTVVPFKYDKVEPFINNIALVTKNAQVGLVDKLGKEIVPVQFNNLKFLDLTYINFLDEAIEGAMTFKLEDEQGNTLAIVDKKTKFLEDSLWYFEGDITSVKQDAQLGYLDNDIAIIPQNQDAIKPFNKGVILVKKDGSIFYIKTEVS
ncbi:MAG: WG repeat-containing protein, partial [Psychrobacter sp.]|nr:WG repeat-containing protein [Psychrobacter sp.]